MKKTKATKAATKVADKGLSSRPMDKVERRAAPEVKERLMEVPIGLVRPDPGQPRKNFKQQTLSELADSIASLGLQQRPAVRWVGPYKILEPDLVETDWRVVDEAGTIVQRELQENLAHMFVEAHNRKEGFYQLIFGERRWRACQLLGWEKLPVAVKELAAGQDVGTVQLVENMQRENLSALEEAGKMKERLADKTHPITAEELAKELGISRATLFGRLALTRISEPVRAALTGGQISTSVAQLVALVPGAKEQAKLLEEVAGEAEPEGKWDAPMPVREVQEMIEESYCKGLKEAPFDKEDAELWPTVWEVREAPSTNIQAPEKLQAPSSNVVQVSGQRPEIPEKRQAYVAQAVEDDGQGHKKTVCGVFPGLSAADAMMDGRTEIARSHGDTHEWEKADLVSGYKTNYACKRCGVKGVRMGFDWPPNTKGKECAQAPAGARATGHAAIAMGLTKKEAERLAALINGGKPLEVTRVLGGACGDCPFRSGNLPGFADAAKRPNLCTQPGCYHQKVKAHWVRLAAEKVKKGEVVLDATTYKRSKGEYVEGGKHCQNCDGYGTWKDLMGKHAPKGTLAATAEGLVTVYPVKEAQAAVRKNGHKFYAEQRELTPEAKAKAAESEKEKQARVMRRKELVAELAPRALAELAALGEKAVWEWVYRTLEANVNGEFELGAKTAKGKALELCLDDPTDWHGEWEKGPVAEWKELGVDLVAEEKRREKEQEKKAPSTKHQAPSSKEEIG